MDGNLAESPTKIGIVPKPSTINVRIADTSFTYTSEQKKAWPKLQTPIAKYARWVGIVEGSENLRFVDENHACRFW